MIRTFILREARHATALTAFISLNWEAMAATARPMQVTLAPYSRKRTDAQNALMWVWITQIAKDAWVHGRQFDADTWHEHFKREFLPEVNARGQEKWRLLPSGERVLAMSTTSLNAAEMGDYMTALAAFAATELGVNLT